MSGGLLGSLLAGAGGAINANADDVIDERTRVAISEAENDKWNTRYTIQKSDADDRLAQEQETTVAQYERKRADDITDTEAEREFALKLAGMKQNANDGTELAKMVETFDSQATNIVNQIDKASSSGFMNETDKLETLAPLYARLDDYLNHNSNLLRLSPMGSVLVNTRDRGLKMFMPAGEDNPSPNPSSNNSEVVVIPSKPSAKNIPQEYTNMKGGKIGGLLPSMRKSSGSDRTY